MGIETIQLQRIISDALKGQTLVIEVSDETELNSIKVRLYRLRRNMETKIPDIGARIGISQKQQGNTTLVVVGPPKEYPVYIQQEDGTLLKRTNKDVVEANELNRLIHLLIRDDVPLEEVREILRIWPEGTMGEYFRWKSILKEEKKNGSNQEDSEERGDEVPGSEES